MRDRSIRAWIAVTEWTRTERGATAVEYALMLALIAMAIMGAVTFLGQSTNNQYANPDLTNTLGS
jgi:Flp pilus assembly pilin Flp